MPNSHKASGTMVNFRISKSVPRGMVAGKSRAANGAARDRLQGGEKPPKV
jgi:hypothetical protein